MNLLVYRATTLENEKSPAELMIDRKIRSHLSAVANLLFRTGHKSFVKQRKPEKEKHKMVTELPPLIENEKVRISNSMDGNGQLKVLL